MDRAEFLKQLEVHKLKLRLNRPARKLPTVAPVRGLRQPVGDNWSTTHPLVGNQILTHPPYYDHLRRTAETCFPERGR